MGRLLDENDIINSLHEFFGDNDGTWSFEKIRVLMDVGIVIGNVPSAQSVHNTGKWVRGTGYGLGIYNWTCKCGHVIAAKVPDRFCGACGCDNEEIID